MRKLIKHKWHTLLYGKSRCEYCGGYRQWDNKTHMYYYSNSYYDRLYRAPECKRLYLSDKML